MTISNAPPAAPRATAPTRREMLALIGASSALLVGSTTGAPADAFPASPDIVLWKGWIVRRTDLTLVGAK